ncbi:hypothetical protein CR513_20710, partial [Mucuna pruriens]
MVTKGSILGHLISSRGIEVNKVKVNIIASLSNLVSMLEVQFLLTVYQEFQQGRPTPVQVVAKGRGFCLRLALRGCFPGAKEETQVCTYSPSIKLGVFIRVNVRRIQLYAMSHPSIEISTEEAGCETKTDLVDVSPLGVRCGDQRQEGCEEYQSKPPELT